MTSTAPMPSTSAALTGIGTQDRRSELGRDLVNAAYLRGDFVLSSGSRSSYYFDKYLFESQPTILRRIAGMLAERVPDDVDRLAGPELGAVALVTALALETGLPFIIVRKNSKKYGTSRAVEGEVHQGEHVLMVEDIISTAGEALRASSTVLNTGARVRNILAVVDREQGGAERIAAAGLRLDALFRLSELPV